MKLLPVAPKASSSLRLADTGRFFFLEVLVPDFFALAFFDLVFFLLVFLFFFFAIVESHDDSKWRVVECVC